NCAGVSLGKSGYEACGGVVCAKPGTTTSRNVAIHATPVIRLRIVTGGAPFGRNWEDYTTRRDWCGLIAASLSSVPRPEFSLGDCNCAARPVESAFTGRIGSWIAAGLRKIRFRINRSR